jgi:hypothetical protein
MRSKKYRFFTARYEMPECYFLNIRGFGEFARKAPYFSGTLILLVGPYAGITAGSRCLDRRIRGAGSVAGALDCPGEAGKRGHAKTCASKESERCS